MVVRCLSKLKAALIVAHLHLVHHQVNIMTGLWLWFVCRCAVYKLNLRWEA